MGVVVMLVGSGCFRGFTVESNPPGAMLYKHEGGDVQAVGVAPQGQYRMKATIVGDVDPNATYPNATVWRRIKMIPALYSTMFVTLIQNIPIASALISPVTDALISCDAPAETWVAVWASGARREARLPYDCGWFETWAINRPIDAPGMDKDLAAARQGRRSDGTAAAAIRGMTQTLRENRLERKLDSINDREFKCEPTYDGKLRCR